MTITPSGPMRHAFARYAFTRCAFTRYAFTRYAFTRYAFTRCGFTCYACTRCGFTQRGFTQCGFTLCGFIRSLLLLCAIVMVMPSSVSAFSFVSPFENAPANVPAPLRTVVPQDSALPPRTTRPIVVASKPFGESFLLAEMFAQLLERHGIVVERKLGLGATDVAFRALRDNAIDVYPEYTGTGLIAILGDTITDAMRADPRRAFAYVATASVSRFGVTWLPPLGFQNGYAIAVRQETAKQYGLRTLSDLAASGATLVGGFTSDFIGRADGWPGLQAAYGLHLKAVRPLAPAIKYQALAQQQVDIIDGYATDGLLAKYDLVTLTDDKRFFPPYDAAALVSPRIERENSDVVAILTQLSGRLTEGDMRQWNRAIEVDAEPIPVVAKRALQAIGLGEAATATAPQISDSRALNSGFWQFFWNRRAETLRLTGEHLVMVLISLALAIVVAVPLSLWLSSHATIAGPVLQFLGVLQTIPGIALLVFMIPLFGIGVFPAIVALWAYALLPIARATYAGVRNADADAVLALEAMGATSRQQLWWARLPLAAPVVLSGIRTAAVLTVGTATLGAFIGAGGLGEPIVTGLGLADARLVMSGALPAAALAVVVDALLALVERRFAPAHLRGSKRSASDEPSREKWNVKREA